MLPADLIRLSTQIAQFFEPYPTDMAVAGVANHITKFWVPEARADLLVLRRKDAAALHPLVVAAADQLAAGVQA